MTKPKKQPKRKRGRPPLEMPEPIDADPVRMVRAAFRVNTRDPGFEWQYDKDDKKRKENKED